MIEPRPFARSLLARSRDNPWNAVRRLVIEGRYEAIGEITGSGAALPVGKRRQPAAGFLYGTFLQPAEGLLYGAFIATAAGNNDRATAMFLRVLEHLPHLSPSHDFWIPLTAFATLPTSGGAVEFEAFLHHRGLLQIEALNELQLPARSNFLLFCIRHRRLGSALALVEHAGPDWSHDDIGLEAWAFRLAALEVLQEAGQYNRLITYGDNYQNLLAAGGVEAGDRTIVEFMLAARMADAAAAHGETSAAVSQYVKALQLADNAAFDANVRGGLLWKLGHYYSALSRVTEAQACFERCISIFTGESNYDLWRALNSLAGLFTGMGRHADAVTLQARRVVLMERDRDCSELVRKFARLDLARALLAGGNETGARRIIDQVVDYAASGDAAARALLLVALRARTELAPIDHGDEQSVWRYIERIIDRGALSVDELEQVAGCVEQIVGSAYRASEREVLALIARLVEAAANVGDEAAGARRRKLLERLTGVEIAVVETTLGKVTESELLGQVERLLGRATTFSHRFALVRIAERAFDEGLPDLGGTIVATLRGLPLPAASNSPDAACWGGELYLYLSNLSLNRMQHPVPAMTLAERGLSALAGGNASERAVAIRQDLLRNIADAVEVAGAEIATAERMLGEVTENDLLSRVELLLDGHAPLPFSHRFGLVRVAERAFQQGHAAVGNAIVAALGDLALPPEANARDAPRWGGELNLYLSNLALNRMSDPVRAAALAECGLSALAADETGDAEPTRRGLLRNLADAKFLATTPPPSASGAEAVQDLNGEITVITEAVLEEATEKELLRRVERLLDGGTNLPFSHRFALVRVAERAFQEGLPALGAAIVTALDDLPLPLEPDAPRAIGWRGELCLYLSNLALNRMQDSARAMALAERGLGALAVGEAGDGTEALRQGLLQNVARAKKSAVAPLQSVTKAAALQDLRGEIAVTEGMLGEATESELLSQVDRLLGHGLATIVAQRGAFAALTERALAQGAAAVGRAILVGISDLPLGKADPSEAATLLLRLCYLALTYLKDPARAVRLAEQGLDFLALGERTDKAARLQRSLSDYLTKARTASARASSPQLAAGDL